MSDDNGDRLGGRMSLNRTMPVRSTPATDSWIEISSQPSSSSLSSAGDNTDRLTRRRLRRRHSEILANIPKRRDSTAGSSQEEYDESESESDRVLGSSNEDIRDSPKAEDIDDNTTLGVGISENTVFTPQPNAFSHPPSQTWSNPTIAQVPGSYFPFTGSPVSAARSNPNQRQDRPTPFRNSTQSSIRQADHDAALRASLTTLLSCAAAVRGSPKISDMPESRSRVRPTQPTSLRLVPESHFLEDDTRPTEVRTQRVPSPRSPKRKARETSKDRHVKKMRNMSKATEQDLILSPTLMSWMISAGVVLVFSAISFSAGYVWGKEVGRFEGETGINTGTCGRELLRSGGGIRSVRWGNATSVRV